MGASKHTPDLDTSQSSGMAAPSPVIQLPVRHARAASGRQVAAVRLVGVAEGAALLGLHARHIYRAVAAGQITAFFVKGRSTPVYSVAELESLRDALRGPYAGRRRNHLSRGSRLPRTAAIAS